MSNGWPRPRPPDKATCSRPRKYPSHPWQKTKTLSPIATSLVVPIPAPRRTPYNVGTRPQGVRSRCCILEPSLDLVAPHASARCPTSCPARRVHTWARSAEERADSPWPSPVFFAPSAVGTRCGLTGGCTHDRLRPSFTLAQRQLPHQAVVSRTTVPCPLPHLRRAASRRRPCCSSCAIPVPIWRGWSRRWRGISSSRSWCPSRAWTPGSGVRPRPGGRSAAGWPSGECPSCGPSGGRGPREEGRGAGSAPTLRSPESL